MKKSTAIKEIQKRLPTDIILHDETSIEFTDNEFVSILSWIKSFNTHYKEYGKEKEFLMKFPIISKRIRLDFGLYQFPSNIENNRGKHVIYIAENGKRLNGTIAPTSIKSIVDTWNL
ncbi:MAG TPA: hypothetical protein VL125_11950 [Pelobium sp.]|nr:hypothetical protein [Pelobium sp.]